MKHWKWLLGAAAVIAAAAVYFMRYDSNSEAKDVGNGTFYNPIMKNGADPWVVYKDGYYYYTQTTGEDIQVWKSATLSGIAGGENRAVWTPPTSGPNTSNIWAPELHWIGGKWYIYYAADDGANENHRMFVLESVTDDPLGEYVDKGRITDTTNKWAIDGTVLQKEDGSLFFIWSGWEGDENVNQLLYIAPMSDPLTIGGDRVEISRPTEAWEQIGTPQVNEGPEVLVHGGKAHIVYSASGSWTDDYALGMLTADLNGDLLDPKAWHKHPEPVFAKNGDVFGPGHASFTKSPDGKQDWIVYHAAKYSGGGWDRNVRIQPFGWNEDGTPSFGAPISTSEAVAMPAGEKGRIRMEAEAAKLTGMTLLKDAKASGGVMAGGWNDGEGSIAFEANAEQEGVYAMTIRYRNDTMSSAILNVNVNDEASLDWKFDNGLNGQWSNEHLSIHLNKGSNTIRFGQGLDGLSIDCIDLLLTSS